MGIKTLITILASLSFAVPALADNHEMGGEKKPFAIHGDFAGSIQFIDSEGVGTNHDEFNVDLAELNIEKNWSKSKVFMSLGFGDTAAAVNPTIAATPLGVGPTNMVNLMEAYYHLMTSYGLGVMFGKFESPVGHETYNHMDNSQYTRSYGFYLAPFFQTGLGLSYGQDMWKVGFIASNGNGFESDRYDNNKTMALTVDVDPMENLHVDLNYVTGTQAQSFTCSTTGNCSQRNMLDVSVAYMMNEMLDFALNYADLGTKVGGGEDEKATSIAAYVNANFGMFGLGLRYEMFSYDDASDMTFNGVGIANLGTGTEESNGINSITLAAKAELDQNAMALLEYRMDTSDEQIWSDKDGAPTDSQNTITAAIMYKF